MDPNSRQINNSEDDNDDTPSPPKIARGTQSDPLKGPKMSSKSTQTDPQVPVEPSSSSSIQESQDCEISAPSTSSGLSRNKHRRLPTIKVCAYCQRRVITPYSRQWERQPSFVKDRWICFSCRNFELFEDGITPPDELRKRNLDPAARKELETLDMYEQFYHLEEKYSITVCCIFCVIILLLIVCFGVTLFLIISRLIRYFSTNN